MVYSFRRCPYENDHLFGLRMQHRSSILRIKPDISLSTKAEWPII